METAKIERKTRETQISLELNKNGIGEVSISTGIGFFDHMLNSFACHSGIDMKLIVKGDLQVDSHHTIEDTGIVIGMALKELLADKKGIARFGNSYIPMDESLAFCAVDISGRPFLVYDAEFKGRKCGEFDTCMAQEFFRAVAYNAGITLHIKAVYGSNDHHKIEAMFKAFAYALKQGMEKNKDNSLKSTKGIL